MRGDKTLVCRECGREFVFTAAERERCAKGGRRHPPGRCKTCQAAAKAGTAVQRGEGKVVYRAVCAACGRTAWVPFQPREDRLVYCKRCMAQMRAERKKR